MTEDLTVLVVVWLLGAALVGVLGAQWNQGGGKWFMLSLLLSPLFALIVLVIEGKRPPA